MGCCSLKLSKPSCACSIGCFWPQFCGSNSEEQCSDRLYHSSRNVHRITSIQSWETNLLRARQEGQIVVANFTASWSNPCKDIAPTYSELADKYSSLLFLTVDADGLAELSSSWDIKALPTFFFLKEGRQVDKLVGANKSELQKKAATMAMLSKAPH
ncbi:thioredoxin H4-1-like [Prosopis cineraria]|uniref:thioredoxin H4-1-like n=1 Tax=Prosopis cineraria TaxID=364024 RepID=UPI00240F36DC|nr:thioredoxin H4-1-like [Prosopis cineraria]